MLITKAIRNTSRLFLVIMIAETAGMMRNENTGITPMIFTAKTIASPIEI
jgi:hypothetical protein